MSELRSWFLRNVLEATERHVGVHGVAAWRAQLPPRLALHAARERLRGSATVDTVPLEEGEELLLSIDSVMGDGSGKLLENIGLELASRMLSQGGTVTRSSDLAGTVARLQAFIEHPFVGVHLLFELRRNPTGFSLSIGVPGHSRATRALRHLTIGAIIATERVAREVGADRLTLQAESIADRCHITARYLPVEESSAEEAPPPSRRRAPLRAPAPSLSAEVERILRSSAPPQARSERPPAAAAPQAMPRPRTVPPPARPATIPPEPAETQPPESKTLRIGNVTGARGPAVK